MSFFSIEQYQRPKRRQSTIPGCGACKLNKTCHSPKMQAVGKGEKQILIIAETPGKKEDIRGTQLIGSPGKFLTRILKKNGIDIKKDCRKINAVLCRPPKGKKPKEGHIEACRPNLLNEIKNNPPKLIISLGTSAIHSLLGHRWPRDLGGIQKWRGWNIPDQDLDIWICPTYHPQYVIRESIKNPAAELLFNKDIKRALKYLKKPIPDYKIKKENIELLIEFNDVLKYLKSFIKNPPLIIAFDYETTGLKPHLKKHRIVTCSFSKDSETATAFVVTNRIKPYLKEIFSNPKIWKIAANMKFEESWTKEKIKTPVINWGFDTMIASHYLDNRPSITSLKFQAFVKYGIIDYSSHIEPFLKGNKEDGGNSFNRIHEIDINELLLYNGYDSILEFRLAIDQLKEMGEDDPLKFMKSRRKRFKYITNTIPIFESRNVPKFSEKRQ